MRKQLSPAQMAAKVAKMKATKEAKKQAALAALGITQERTKVRKKRKMTEEQKEAARQRLAAARANRGPSTNKLIPEDVRNLPDEHPLSLKNVRQWLKENKLLLSSISGYKNSKESKERDLFNRTETYVANMESYLRGGVWLDLFFGPNQEKKIKYKVTHGPGAVD